MSCPLGRGPRSPARTSGTVGLERSRGAEPLVLVAVPAWVGVRLGVGQARLPLLTLADGSGKTKRAALVPGLNGCNLAPLHHGRPFNWLPQCDFGWGEGQHAGRCRRACELHTGKWHPDLLREAGPRARCAVGLWATGEARHWTTVADILADAYTVITYDRRGNSRSPRPPGWTSTTAGEQADAAAALLRGLDLVPAIVFGTSATAGILAGLCLRHPHVLRGAIFHEPAFPSGVPDIGAINAARQARVEEGMARSGPRATMELFLRGAAGDEAYASLDPQLRERLLATPGSCSASRWLPTSPTSPHPASSQRMAMPLAREVVKDLAVEHGACIRPIQLRRANLDTGEQDTVLVPCGHTLAHVCPSCAERARTLRAAQCREGWHLEDEPDIAPDPATEAQKFWVETRAEAQQLRDQAASAGQDTTDFDELVRELDEEITKAGVRGKAASDRPVRRHRSTRRRQDAPDLPRRKVSPRTVARPTPRRTARSSAPPCSSP